VAVTVEPYKVNVMVIDSAPETEEITFVVVLDAEETVVVVVAVLDAAVEETDALTVAEPDTLTVVLTEEEPELTVVVVETTTEDVDVDVDVDGGAVEDMDELEDDVDRNAVKFAYLA